MAKHEQAYERLGAKVLSLPGMCDWRDCPGRMRRTGRRGAARSACGREAGQAG